MTSDDPTRLTEVERTALADEVLGGADPSPLMPPSEHQRRRMDAMAEHIETLTAQLTAAQSALAACREVAAKRAGR